MAKEMEAGRLLAMVNEIDSRALAEGGPLFATVFEVGRRAAWLKGLAILKFYPELEEQLDKPGRPKKSQTSANIRDVAKMLGRAERAVAGWLKLVRSVGKTKEEFDRWLKAAQAPVLESFSLKLLAADNGKPRELDRPLVVKDVDLLQIEERYRAEQETREDTAWLIRRVRVQTKVIDKALRLLLDEKPAEAAKALERGVEE